MSVYSHLPPIKPPRSMAWYSSLAAEQDDALVKGLRLLESLRGALPPQKAAAIDEAEKLLISAAKLYTQSRDANENLPYDPSALADLLTPEKKKFLGQLCTLVLQDRAQ